MNFTRRCLSIITVTFVLTVTLSAQFIYSSAVSFLVSAPSAASVGAGGFPLFSLSPTSTIFQPAHMGALSRSTLGSVEFFLEKPLDVNTGLFNKSTFNVYSIMAGSTLFTGQRESIVSFAAGYSRLVLNYGEITLVNGSDPSDIRTFHPVESSDNFTVGAAFDLGVILTTGVTIKQITSKFPSFNGPGGSSYYTARPAASDIGVGVFIPVIKLLVDDTPSQRTLSPSVNVSLSYALNNFGEDVVYTDINQKDPLPRIGRLYWSADAGIMYTLSPDVHLQLCAIGVSRESEAALFKRRNDGSFYYTANPVGSTNIYKSLIAGLYYDNIAIRKGFALSLFETIFIVRGFYQFAPIESYTTSGYGISTRGLFVFIGSTEWMSSNAIDFLLKHLEVRYVSRSFDSRTIIFGTSPFESIVVSLTL